MMVAATQSLDAGTSPSSQSLWSLDAINFLIAGLMAGFGPFIALFLADEAWSAANVGYVLSAGSIVALLSQLPGGELLDAVRSKQLLLAVGVLMVGLSAVIIAVWPHFVPVLVSQVLLGMTGGFIGPAIAAISLGLVGHEALAERLGRNQRFQSIGNLTMAGLIGVIGYSFSARAMFLATAMLVIPTLFALARMRSAEIHYGQSVGAPDHHEITRPPRVRRLSVYRRHGLLVFASCLFLFQMANASILPLASETLGHGAGRQSSLIVSGLVIVPQILVALIAPWTGEQAQSWGRRPLLLLGFGALTIRALLFVLISNPQALIAVQLLDGVSGAALGVLQALIVADLTNGTGRFNLAQGFVGVVSGLGASLSTAVSGFVAQNLNAGAGFLPSAGIALVAFIVVLAFMPETKPKHHRKHAARSRREHTLDHNTKV
jgi:MFS family permease